MDAPEQQVNSPHCDNGHKTLLIVFLILFGLYLLIENVSIDEVIQPLQACGQSIVSGIIDY